MVAEHDGVELQVTKWYDNKAAHLLSTYMLVHAQQQMLNDGIRKKRNTFT